MPNLVSMASLSLRFHFIGVAMPTVVVHLPKGVFPPSARQALGQSITRVAAECEQIPDEPKRRGLCWVLIHEVEAGNLTCGGFDVTRQVLPCFALVNLPAGVLDEHSRTQYVEGMHAAFKSALPADDKRPVMSSVVLNDVADGTWGANGAIWTLPHFAKMAGYAHLQHLTAQ
jgi:phenylpyruvate tautomerase PptA (4-oxalocrotonate tautomerase family)